MKSMNFEVQHPNKYVLPPLQTQSRESSPRRMRCDTQLPYAQHTHYPTKIGKKAVEPLRPEPFLLSCMSSDPLLKISQLEQNLIFLQDQHQMMLSSLHQEIESLRLRNRDLQFQLIFGSGTVKVIPSSSDSSPDDGTQPKIVLSPKEINSRSLQVEMLEREVSELKVALSEANSKNSNLLQLVDHQKKQLDSAKKEQASAKKEQDPDLTDRLEDAENLIKRLVKENDDQRKEMSSLRGQVSRNGHGGGRYSGHRRGGNDHQRFPPLQTQNFWGGSSHSNQKHKSSNEFHSNHGQMDHEVVGQAAPALPHLTRTFSQPSSTRHRYYSNGNHFYRGNSNDEGEGRRRYRGRGSAGHHKDSH